MVADGFDGVAVRIEYEGAVIVWVVVRTQSRRTVVATARGERSAIEGVYLITGVGAKRDVNRRLLRLTLADPEIRFRWRTEPCPFKATGLFGGELHEDLVSERRERGEEEGFAFRVVADAEAGVVDHFFFIRE